MNLRLDKFVWCVRLAKTRSIATDLIQKGKIKLNNAQVKPSREVKIGDTVSLVRNNAVFSFKIKDLLDRRVGAKLVPDYLIDITEKAELEKYQEYRDSQRAYREYGTGRPSRKDREQISSFFDWLEDEDE